MGIAKYSEIPYITKGGIVKKDSAYSFSSISRYTVADKMVRVYDTVSRELAHSKLTQTCRYDDSVALKKIRTEDDYEIVISDDCSILTIDGFKKVSELAVEDVIFANGSEIPLYKDKSAMELLYIKKGKSQKEIAEMCGVSPRTIRAWVDKHELHRGDAGALFGEDNPNWEGDDVSKDGGYSRTHLQVDSKLTGICSRCGAKGNTQVHHDDRNPTNIDGDNLIELCMLCHKAEHMGFIIRHIRPARITEIAYAGHEETYGFSVENGYVVAQGFIIDFPEGGRIKVKDVT